ncbi:MFS transporter [Actinomadura sp. DC4]|uniref:MFS transporter n=1 Tax=Actinomadura sp. DC4 TaxID=3055069 RepID=UPI0025AEF228|nr:MFS transporter [Actinomadura sp. DC4]MDN3355641.1 MFS transporter [Actinomadura sp. DC4]
MSITAPTAHRHGAKAAPPAVSRRWTALFFIALAQLMVVLDATIVNIALPSAQRALDISDGNRQWVITAYTLVFGGLLLFGGRIADLVGRKRTFLIGLVGFAGASALGGAAVNEGMLLAARALQGAFGALLAPSALSLLAVMFTQPRERAKAFGIYGAIAGGGSAVGLILGGVLTEYLNWRWALYVNVPIAIGAFIGAAAFVHVTLPTRGHQRARLDIPGVVLVTAGLVSLVYGFTRAESEGWGERGVIGLFVAAALLLIAFVVVEALTRAPLLPLRVVLNRNRGGAYLAVGLAVIAMFGLFLFLTYYMQIVKGYSPVRSGLAFLPFTAGMITGSTQISARLMHRVPARVLMVPGLVLAAIGMALLTQLSVHSSFFALILPAELLISLGLGSTMMPAMNLATTGVSPQDAGVASAMVNTAQQVGGSIGTALLNTIAATATTTYVVAHAHGRPTRELLAVGQVHGFTVAIAWGVGIILLAAVLVAVLINGKEKQRPAAEPKESPRGIAAEPAPEPLPLASGSAIGGRIRGAGGTPLSDAVITLVELGGRQLGRVTTKDDGSYDLGVPAPGSYVLIAAADGHQPQAATVTVGGEPLFYELTLSGTSGLTGVVHSAVTGAALAGARVVVTDLRGEVVASAETDQNGRFAIEDLVAGTVTVVASADGHRPSALPVEVNGQATTRCDVELRAGGRVRGTVRGGVEDRPLSDARVALVNAAGDTVAVTTTSSDGGYTFTDLDAGDYTLTASAYEPATATMTIDGPDQALVDLRLGHVGE